MENIKQRFVLPLNRVCLPREIPDFLVSLVRWISPISGRSTDRAREPEIEKFLASFFFLTLPNARPRHLLAVAVRPQPPLYPHGRS